MKGWVRNLDDGSVEVYAIGSRAEHDELSGHLRKGPNMSDIRSMELQRPRRRS
jgi:acylphosphatase